MMKRPKVVVRAPVPQGALKPLQGLADIEVLEGSESRSELLRILADAEGLIALLTDSIDAELLAAGPNLRVIANFATGVNNVDLKAAEASGVWVTNTPDVLTDATADLTLGLMLAVMRRFDEGQQQLRAGAFTGWRPTYLLGQGMTGKTLGLVGFGRIGKAVARRAMAFGMTPIYTRKVQQPVRTWEGRARQVALDELLATSDVVSLHVPLAPDTRHLINARALDSMRHDAVLINTARGPVVDEAALAEALHAGHIAGAGLDVYENEPHVHPRLLAAPNCVVLPHLGSNTLEARRRMGELAALNVAHVLHGERPPTPVVGPGHGRPTRAPGRRV